MTKDEPLRTPASGRVRDALAAIHNLETLLRSPRIGAGPLTELAPDLLASCGVLRLAFEGAERELADYARGRLEILEQALTDAIGAGLDTRARLALEHVLTHVRVEIDAAVGLLDLATRARGAARGELSLGELTRAALGLAGSIPPSSEGVLVRVDTEDASCIVLVDPQVVASVLGGAVVRVREDGVRDIVVRARCLRAHVTLTVCAAGEADAARQHVMTRGMRRIPPTDAALATAAEAMGGHLTVAAGSVVLSLPIVGEMR